MSAPFGGNAGCRERVPDSRERLLAAFTAEREALAKAWQAGFDAAWFARTLGRPTSQRWIANPYASEAPAPEKPNADLWR